MAVRHRRRAAGASAISLALHGLFLAAMALGLRAVEPPPEPPPIQVRLIAPFAQDRPRRVVAPSPQPSRALPRAVATPRLAPSAPAPIPLPPSANPNPAPPVATVGEGGPKGLLPSLTGRLGCDDPITFHLNKDQLAVCEQRLAETAKAAKPLALDIAAAKLAEYDRNRRCRDVYSRGAIPSSASHDESTGAFNSGLGYNPRLRDCAPSDR